MRTWKRRMIYIIAVIILLAALLLVYVRHLENRDPFSPTREIVETSADAVPNHEETPILTEDDVRNIENRNLYFPTREIVEIPADIGLNHEEISIITDDDVRINGWYFPLNTSKGVVLFFCGNAENISYRLDIPLFFLPRGYEVFMVDYRGYGKSEGRPSEKGLYLDAEAAYDFLRKKGKEPEDIIVYGFSLGGAVATDLAFKQDVSLLIVQSSFESVAKMGRKMYPHLPVSWIIKQRYDSILKIDKVNAPVVIIHSPEDDVIPFEHGLALFSRAAKPKLFIKTSGIHCETPHFTNDEHVRELINFIEKCRLTN